MSAVHRAFEQILPMKAAPGELPTPSEAHRWGFEVKWDGMRIVAHTDGDRVLLRSSNGIDATDRFPELGDLASATDGRPAVLDGEVIAVRDGRPSFEALQHRMHVANPVEAQRRAATQPVHFLLFDLLHFDGNDALALPYSSRRHLLTELIEPATAWRVTDLHDDGQALLDAVHEQSLEGVIAKQLDSPYVAGKRSPLWRKIKVRRHAEFVVGGWAPGKGSRTGAIGGLLLGYRDEPGGAELHYAGRVGSGLTDPEIKRLMAQFGDAERSTHPFSEPPPTADAKGATWLEPTVVVEVAYAEWGTSGRLRHPSYMGQRIDVDPFDVVREP